MSTELTTTARPFLSARWQHLILANYSVDAALLTPHLPPGLTLDLLDGDAHVSLVAFDFLDTRVLGIPWPGYRDFPEINLRFYVRDGERRGVVFIREYVPKRAIAWIAKWLYNEPYRYAPMHSSVEASADKITVEHGLRIKQIEHTIKVVAKCPPVTPDESSEAHYFKEHSWGYGTGRNGQRVTYEVTHPVWSTFEVETVDINLDWGAAYGETWAFLNEQVPRSVVLALGSEVAVSPKQSPNE